MTNTIDVHFTAPMPKISDKAKQRANFTHYHLNSALIFANCARELEKYCKDDQQKKNVIHVDYISYVSSSIMASVAALESNINEMFIDFREQYEAAHKNNATPTNMMVQAINVFSDDDMFKAIIGKQKKLISKYMLLSVLKNKGHLIAETYYFTLAFIYELRVRIVHFMPEWDYEKRKHESIKENYKKHFSSEFSLSPIYHKNALFFPCLCLSASCATWCMNTVKEFIGHYKSEVIS